MRAVTRETVQWLLLGNLNDSVGKNTEIEIINAYFYSNDIQWTHMGSQDATHIEHNSEMPFTHWSNYVICNNLLVIQVNISAESEYLNNNTFKFQYHLYYLYCFDLFTLPVKFGDNRSSVLRVLEVEEGGQPSLDQSMGNKLLTVPRMPLHGCPALHHLSTCACLWMSAVSGVDTTKWKK